MTELTDLSLTTVARLIARRDASAREVTMACLARIERLQPELNAFITLDAEAALASADAADATRGERGPLHGVPLAHKDMYYRAGRVSTCGSVIRRHWRATRTATVLGHLDRAGAIDLGTLNMAEWAMGPTGHNVHQGACRNPWDTLHMTGGSSSGAAAGTAARLFFGALGSDTGASIRLPAHCCGLVGLKTTMRRVSRANAMPLSWSLDTVGPLARTAADAALLYATIAGHDPDDPLTSTLPVGDVVAGLDRPVRGLRIGIERAGWLGAGIEPDSAARLAAAERTFAGLGCTIVDLPPLTLEHLGSLWNLVMKPEAARLHRSMLRARPEDYSPQVRSRLEGGLLVPATRYLEALDQRGPELRAFAAAVLERCDVLLTAVADGPAPTLIEADVQDPSLVPAFVGGLIRRLRIFNYLGVPALAVPCGLVRGLPVAMQLVGRPFDEATLLRLGHAFEQATGPFPAPAI